MKKLSLSGKFTFASLLFIYLPACMLLTSCADEQPPAPPILPEEVLKEQGIGEQVTYSSGQEMQFTTSDNIILKANIYKMADAQGKLPGAIIIGAADGSDTSSTLYLANMLSARGIVCLTFYARGCVPSGGFPMGHNWEWQKDDAMIAIKELLKDANVDPLRIGFIGMDEGAEIALFAAAAYNKPCFGVTGSLPLVAGDEKVIRGFNDPVKTALAIAQKEYKDGKINFEQLSEKQKSILTGHREGYRIPVTADDSYWTWFSSWQSLSGINFLGKTKSPVLMLYGASDNFKSSEAMDVADEMLTGFAAKHSAVETTEEPSLVDAYHKKQLSVKTIATIASWIQSVPLANTK